MMAMGLCVLVILTAMSLVLSALKSNDKGTGTSTGQTLAQDTVENYIYGLPTSGSFWTASSFASPYQTDQVALGVQTFQRAIYVTDLGSTSPGLRQVAVRVTWQGGQAGRSGMGTQIVEVSRLVAQP